MLENSEHLAPYQKPELDILTYLPRAKSMTELDRVSNDILLKASSGPKQDQIHLATYVIEQSQISARGFTLIQDAPKAKILRSVLMKPEHELLVPELHSRVEAIAASLL
jgi:hypothetical protein